MGNRSAKYNIRDANRALGIRGPPAWLPDAVDGLYDCGRSPTPGSSTLRGRKQVSIESAIQNSQQFLREEGISGWLLYDYRGMNPIFWDTVGPIANVTRPC